jgi:hypothetical protein
MVLIGILTTFAGFLISFFSLAMASGVNGRMLLVLLGIAVSLFGIIGLLCPAFNKNAIWKR